jgi:hypothetical protein
MDIDRSQIHCRPTLLTPTAATNRATIELRSKLQCEIIEVIRYILRR